MLIHSAGNLASILLGKQRADEELARREEQLRCMVAQLTVAEEGERRRVSRILHDELSPTLAVCQMRVSVLESSSNDPDGQQILHEIRERLEECTQQARSLAVETSPPVLYELGLAPAIEWLAERFEGNIRFAARSRRIC